MIMENVFPIAGLVTMKMIVATGQTRGVTLRVLLRNTVAPMESALTDALFVTETMIVMTARTRCIVGTSRALSLNVMMGNVSLTSKF
mgnify:CR=1 FL=1